MVPEGVPNQEIGRRGVNACSDEEAMDAAGTRLKELLETVGVRNTGAWGTA